MITVYEIVMYTKYYYLIIILLLTNISNILYTFDYWKCVGRLVPSHFLKIVWFSVFSVFKCWRVWRFFQLGEVMTTASLPVRSKVRETKIFELDTFTILIVSLDEEGHTPGSDYVSKNFSSLVLHNCPSRSFSLSSLAHNFTSLLPSLFLTLSPVFLPLFKRWGELDKQAIIYWWFSPNK